MLFTTTVAAVATPPGKGGVAVIRISGADALSVAKRMFLPRGNTPLDNVPPRKQIYGDILLRGEAIDDGLITYFKGPNSYTGEDIVEISCHGGILVTAKVLESALISGAVLAGPGEFTKRAFVGGKLTLTETEAIGMLLDAESDAQIRLAKESSRSRLRDEVSEIRSDLVSLLSSIYARIDYPEEDLGEFTDEQTLAVIDSTLSKISALSNTYSTGHAVKEGIATVICGKPNVGKSTLYNLLVGEDAAIVTDIPGTTRDVLERSAPLGKVILRLSDTAGIRGGDVDAVEVIGIQRSKSKATSAELILALFDSQRGVDHEDVEILEFIKNSPAAKIAIFTKNDKALDKKTRNNVNYNLQKSKRMLEKYNFSSIIDISCDTDPSGALTLLTEEVDKLFVDEKIRIGTDAVISSARQFAALERAKEHLNYAKDAYLLGIAQDAASSDIELALGAVSELDGRQVTEQIVDSIFARFCVGK